MSEQCDYVFEFTNNRCKRPKEHMGGHTWWADDSKAPTEMTSLTQIKAKLDELLRKVDCIDTVQDAIRFEAEQDRKTIAESQGKLLAAIDEHDQWAKAMRAEDMKRINDYAQREKEWAKKQEEGVNGLSTLLEKQIKLLQSLQKRKKGKR